MSMAHRKLYDYFTFHPTLAVFVVISFLTGTFMQLFIILCIVMVHELGHFFAAKHFNWRIESVMLWAFGGVMKTDEYATRPLKEEFIVTICGPLQHGVIFILAFTAQHFSVVPDAIIADILYFNVIILLFNLLPIYPLDGGKLCLMCLSLILPYRQAYRTVLILSFIVACVIIIGQLILFPFTFTATLLLIFLIVEINKFWRNEYFTFIRFLLFRLHGRQQFNKTKYIYAQNNDRLMDLFNQFKRNKLHRLYVTSHTFISEKKGLHYYFNDHRHSESVYDIVRRK